MGKYHSDLMVLLFPNQKPIGIDLPEKQIEIKESFDGKRIQVRKKDNKAKILLIYDWITEFFMLIDNNDLPFFSKSRSFSLNQLKRVCFFQTNDVWEIVEKVEKLEAN